MESEEFVLPCTFRNVHSIFMLYFISVQRGMFKNIFKGSFYGRKTKRQIENRPQ